MRILEQRTRADGYRRLHGIKEGEEVGYQRIGQLSPHEMLQDLFVGSIAESNGIEIVLLHELIEEVGTEYDGLRNRHLSILVLVQLCMPLDDIIEESQATTLATQRTVANTGEMAIGIELQTVEYSHHADVLHAAILYDGVEDNLTVGIDILQFMPGDMLQEGRDREDGTGTEPTAHVVSRHMVEHRIVGNLEDIVL